MIDTTKSVVMHEIEKLMKDRDNGEDIGENTAEQRVIIFDGMAILNKIKLGTGIRERFLSILLNEPSDEVRVVFDRYIKESLKKTTCRKRHRKVEAAST